MKILQILPSLSAGGAEGFVTNLGVSLRALGAEVQFYVLGGVRGERGRTLQERLLEAGVVVHGARERYPASPGNFLELARLLCAWRPDIVQANLYQAEVVATVARLATLYPRVGFFRRLASTDFVGYRSPAMVRAMDRSFPQVIACSPAVAEAYRAFAGPDGRARLTMIPNGGLLLDSPPDREARLRARRDLSIPETGFVVAHVGRFSSGGQERSGGLEHGPKAHDVLIRAFARAFPDDPGAWLALLGDGPLLPAAEALARELGVADRVRFPGQLPEPWPALMAADLFFFPSRYEGLPNVLPEAASAGLPVLASDIPQIASLSPGDAWLLAPVNDEAAFATALRGMRDALPEYRQRALEAAPGIRERFSMETCARRYLEAFENALKNA